MQKPDTRETIWRPLILSVTIIGLLIGPISTGTIAQTQSVANDNDCVENLPLKISDDNDNNRIIIVRVTENCTEYESPVITVYIYNNATDGPAVAGEMTVEAEDANPDITALTLITPTNESTPTSPITTIIKQETPREEQDELRERQQREKLDFEVKPEESPAIFDITFTNREEKKFNATVTIDSTIGAASQEFTLVVERDT
jgi:hypothetical protein